jgi:hypothetical protein
VVEVVAGVLLEVVAAVPAIRLVVAGLSTDSPPVALLARLLRIRIPARRLSLVHICPSGDTACCQFLRFARRH